VLRLWEALWSRHLSPQFHIYCAAAVLVHHRRAIMERDLDFDGLLKFCIELSGRLDLEAMLALAERLFEYAGEAGADIMAGLP
jgi:TBC1 domain family member 15